MAGKITLVKTAILPYNTLMMENWNYEYYGYDGNGNLVTKNYGSPAAAAADDAPVYVDNNIYSSDYAFAYIDRNAGSGGGAGAERKDYVWNERNLLRKSVNKQWTVITGKTGYSELGPTPASEVMMHELISHAVPLMPGKDNDNVIHIDNIAREQIGLELRKSDPSHTVIEP